MLGKHMLKVPAGTLLFEIQEKREEDGSVGKLVKVQLVEVGTPMNPAEVFEKENELILKSVFFMQPGHVHTAVLTWEDGCFQVSGSYALVGEISGRTEPFTGKTKLEVMLEELPKKRTGKTIRRTEQEIAKEVDSLLQKMTLKEKIGQMSQSSGNNTAAIGSDVKKEMSQAEMIAAGMLGSTIAMNSPEVIFEQQKTAVEESRLGIPLFFCQDVIHGYQTIFPIPLGWSCSFDPELVEKAGRVAAKEVTPRGIMYAFSPMLDIARDPRWGRVSEGNGEDPYLCLRMCEAHVRGFQGEDLSEDDTMMACLKHFIGYSAAEAGRDYNTAEISETTLHNTYLPPFRAGVKAGAASVMNSFNTMNGVPVVINQRISNRLLREEIGFEGILVSDFASVDEAIVHGAAEDGMDAACKALNASLDIEMATNHYNENLERAVREGRVAESQIDDCVKRILTYKYKTGLMDDPYKYLRPEEFDNLLCEEHRKVARELGRESLVLLKNNGILPLARDKKIALIGPKGDSTDLLGPWQFSQFKDRVITLKQGLIEEGYEVITEQGSRIHEALPGGVGRAVEAAENADVVFLALGEDSSMSGEAASRQNIVIPEAQMELAKAVKETGKPLALVLTNGRPLLLSWFEENADAILETWFAGTEAGHSIADIISGRYHPSGKLSISFPENPGQIPVYYNHLNTGRPYTPGDSNKFLSKYLDGPNTPLYSFGYGLSYTEFSFSKLSLSSHTMKGDEKITASVHVENTGSREGSEVVQLYIRDIAASIARPVKELKGFERITLLPGEEKIVSFTVDKEALKFYNQENEYIAEPGRFELWIGNSSLEENLLKDTFELTEIE